MNIHKAAYREEAQELLLGLETAILELEERPEDADLIARIFRVMHTLKGSGSMFGFDGVAEFTHELETVYDLVRNNVIKITDELINISLAARDLLLLMIEADNDQEMLKSPSAQNIIGKLKTIINSGTLSANISAERSAPGIPGELDAPTDQALYWISFRPNPELFYFGANPILLLDELKSLGKAIVLADLRDVPRLTELRADKCHTGWEIFLSAPHNLNTIKDVFLFVEENSYLEIRRIHGDLAPELTHPLRQAAQLLVERGDLAAHMLQPFCEDPGFMLEFVRRDRCDQSLTALLSPAQTKQPKTFKKFHQVGPSENDEAAPRPRSEELMGDSSIRVASKKLDALLNLVGEMVTVQARLNQLASHKKDSEISSIAEETERLISELRDNTMNIRMLPIGATFSKFKRLVRDLSRELNKDVTLITAGSETELDKTVIEKLHDPLIHIIRNSMDHGLETEAARRLSGKPPSGVIKLSAFHAGATVVIEVADDGAGVDPEIVRHKAIRNGIIAENAILTDNELVNLIFMPGFSTVEKITDVSGRGVGMDVVKRNVEALRGTVTLSSEKNKGVKVSLRLPLTLAIIDGLLVKIGEGFFIIPVSMVKECIELTGESAIRARNANIIDFRGRIVPFIDLRELFQLGHAPPLIEPVVIADVEGESIGLSVDRVIGQHQTVLKPLGTIYKNIKQISGATILGDGTVALILDVLQILQSVRT